MQLTPQQLAAIVNWAETTPGLRKVVLFGSRAKDKATPESDADIGIWLCGGEATQRLADYILNKDEWTDHLEKATRLKVQLELVDDELTESVQHYIEAGHKVLWP